jgi:hypothetical protein
MRKTDNPDFVTIKTALAIIGGERPVHHATYYRGVAAGRYPAPEHPSPGISRVRRADLIAAINRNAKNGGEGQI